MAGHTRPELRNFTNFLLKEFSGSLDISKQTEKYDSKGKFERIFQEKLSENCLAFRYFIVCLRSWAAAGHLATVCKKLQTLFLFSCNVIGFFKQALWKVHVWDNFRWEFLKAQNRISDTPFYSCILRCKVFDLEWGWGWPCCDRDQYLDSMIAGTTCCDYSSKVNWGISNQSEYAQHIA